MSTETLSGELFARMVRGGAAGLNARKKEVNDLNVFPIPDGDTGDNMHMTIKAGADCGTEGSLDEVSKSVSSGMLLGARGNSGVILSRFFAGIAKAFAGIREADAKTFVTALRAGVKESYDAVSTPVEGTILTVMRESVTALEGSDPKDLEDCFEILLPEMQASLDRTPELLAVLKEAGVVDSGGAGLLCIFSGMQAALQGQQLSAGEEGPAAVHGSVDLDSFTSESELTFGYCTEFLLRLQSAKTDVEHFDESVLTDWLCSVGDSVVAFKDGSIVKVHVHTKTPGEILNHCQQYGEFLTLKIENMTLQHHGATIRNSFTKERKAVGTVAVASGTGLEECFREAGADLVIAGGQTMNPSAQSFVDAFGKVNAETIFVFPNNSNIIMTARQAAELCTDSKVIVIPTKTIAEGYCALASMDRSIKDSNALEASILETIAGVTTGMTSTAIRESSQDGIQVHPGDCLGFSGGHILAAGQDETAVVLELCDKIGLADSDVAIIFTGKDARKAEETVQAIQKACPFTELIIKDGGQPVYQYIIALC